MNSKTIFISIPWFLPAYKAGGPIQSIANMVYNLDEGFTFYIFTSNTDLQGQAIPVSITNEWLNYNSYTKVWYAGKRNRSQHLVDQVKAIRPDALFIIGMFDWHYNIVPMLYAECAHKIISVRGMLHTGALQQKPLKKKIFLQGMKWMKLNRKCHFHATDITEAGYIRDTLGSEVVINTAGNFPRLFPIADLPAKEKDELKLVSVGIISPMKNYLVVLQALAGIKSNVNYNIYGPVKDAGYWELCLEAIRQLPSNISVHYHPELPAHEVNDRLVSEQVFILPSKSENYGHAIVEALSAGLPVISSQAVPWLQLAEFSAGINVAEDAVAIGDAIKYFAGMDQDAFEKYHLGAASYIRDRIDNKKLETAYREMFEQ